MEKGKEECGSWEKRQCGRGKSQRSEGRIRKRIVMWKERKGERWRVGEMTMWCREKGKGQLCDEGRNRSVGGNKRRDGEDRRGAVLWREEKVKCDGREERL